MLVQTYGLSKKGINRQSFEDVYFIAMYRKDVEAVSDKDWELYKNNIRCIIQKENNKRYLIWFDSEVKRVLNVELIRKGRRFPDSLYKKMEEIELSSIQDLSLNSIKHSTINVLIVDLIKNGNVTKRIRTKL